jgi:hypothetical protein
VVGRPGTRIVALTVLAVVASGCSFLERSSVSSAPANIVGTAASRAPSLSQSGRYVAFTSSASNLVAGDTNGVDDVFVRDNVAHKTTRVSVATNGAQANGASFAPDISDDGRYVAFASLATNLTTGDSNNLADLYVRDRLAASTVIASVSAHGVAVGSWSGPELSGDGRTVAFLGTSTYPDVPGSFPNGPIIRHLDTGTTSDLRRTPPIGVALAMPGPVSLSDDGRRVASIPFVLGGQQAIGEATVRDTTTGEVIADLGPATVPLDPNHILPIALSGDGTRFALGFVPEPGGPTRGSIRVGRVADPLAAHTIPSEFAVELALSDTGSTLAARIRTVFGDVAMVADPAVGEFQLVSTIVPATSVVVIGAFALSGDGRWVAYDSTGTDVATGDSHGVAQVYTRSVARSMDPPT